MAVSLRSKEYEAELFRNYAKLNCSTMSWLICLQGFLFIVDNGAQLVLLYV